MVRRRTVVRARPKAGLTSLKRYLGVQKRRNTKIDGDRKARPFGKRTVKGTKRTYTENRPNRADSNTRGKKGTWL